MKNQRLSMVRLLVLTQEAQALYARLAYKHKALLLLQQVDSVSWTLDVLRVSMLAERAKRRWLRLANQLAYSRLEFRKAHPAKYYGVRKYLQGGFWNEN